MRGKACTVCRHREVASINLALSRGISPQALAKRYGLSHDSLYRHRVNHIGPALKARLLAGPDLSIDLDRLREIESQSLLANLVSLRHRLLGSFDLAEEHGDTHMIARLSAQIHHNLEITGKLLGDLGIGSTTINNVLIMPEYVELRTALTRALQPFPEARMEVARVLHAIEHRAATEIAADNRELAH